MDSSDSEGYKVEDILKKRKRNGEIQYLVKWEGFPESDNSWEVKEHIKSNKTIKSFEDKLKGSPQKKLKEASSMFEKGCSVEKLFGATEESGEIYFFVKWSGMDKTSFETKESLLKHCPQLLCKFYQDRLDFDRSSHVDKAEDT